MDVKEYLSQAYWIDKRINSELQHTEKLHALATRVTASIYAERVSDTKQNSSMEEAAIKLIDLENEINSNINNLVELKKEMSEQINSLDNNEYKLLLETRYLNFLTWREIADIMNYSTRQVLRIHGKALTEFDEKTIHLAPSRKINL